ncbi:HCO3 transporter family-domain-containing protein [Crucibulum laeve]|uniref:HCO3 transporter family-domain-containing protein n=1 Tax=Crucibulum laeve TaxID=68775 RepID=A0A5C3M5V5_9AGAR|nr:HCO3 transporter family-domain-containing protein [Crucibulum laeve]
MTDPSSPPSPRPESIIHHSKEQEARDPPGTRSDSKETSAASATLRTPTRKRFAWFQRLGAGIVLDVKARAPWYVSDWSDAWNYRVVPATALIFFANVLPGIAFSLDLIETTRQYGVAEVLIASFMAAFIFSVFGAQPLTIAGVTGPITVFNKVIFNILEKEKNPPIYLHFIGWVYLWGAIFHWVTAILNWCNFLKYVTLFSCDTFGFYVSWVYLQYGIQVLTRQFVPPDSPGAQGTLVSIILALLMLITSFLFQSLSQTTYFHRHVRRFLADYGMPISLIATSAMAYWGRFNATNPLTLPVGGAFQAAGGREWLVKFWQLEGKWVGTALPFGFILWILFFFDHNVSSLMAQGSEFPLRKPPGFHWDFFLLGVTTFIAGLIGVPAPNGLIPQAPIHTASLTVMGRSPKLAKDEEQQPMSTSASRAPSIRNKGREGSIINDSEPQPDPTHANRHEVPIAVVEQRVSNLAQGSLCLVLLSGPFLHVLSLIPRGVLAGLFWYMGADALRGNGITKKILYLIEDRALTSKYEPLCKVRKSRIVLFVGVQLIGFGTTFAVTQTIAAVGFPVIILLLLPIRTLLIPRLPFTAEELAVLDGPTASPFTMESVGGTL